ncbi:MAG: ABC transporter ATP-binding protein [Clostridia bacterium]|nr:ABC transporter ATP-binding protein [Clostridia bacterium]
MIEIRNVKKEYRSGEKSFFALNGVSLEIGEGEFVAITGKSGSGKSTLLNMIGTLDTVTEGNIFVDGQDIAHFTGKQIAEFRNRTVGFVFQSFYLEPSYTVYDNVELPLVLSGSVGKKNRERVEGALKAVNLSEKITEKARNLSGGEQQRVAIARAIVNNPAYILADEPCGNLDSANSENIMRILKELHAAGKTIVMVTHDPEDAQKAERIVTMSDGKVANDTKRMLDEIEAKSA